MIVGGVGGYLFHRKKQKAQLINSVAPMKRTTVQIPKSMMTDDDPSVMEGLETDDDLPSYITYAWYYSCIYTCYYSTLVISVVAKTVLIEGIYSFLMILFYLQTFLNFDYIKELSMWVHKYLLKMTLCSSSNSSTYWMYFPFLVEYTHSQFPMLCRSQSYIFSLAASLQLEPLKWYLGQTLILTCCRGFFDKTAIVTPRCC